jgi:hypothetical protein
MNVCKYKIVNDSEVCGLCAEYNGMCGIEVCEVEMMITSMFKWINDYFEMLIDEGVVV